MSTVTAAVLEPTEEAHIALESVDIQANLRGLLSEVAVTQVYRNLEDINIEAVYTFPLPLDAVLLDLTLELNGKTLRGVVQPKYAAEERYEEAVTDGDSAVLLQKVEPGVFTLNVGNILPGERAVIRFKYGLLHRWQGDRLRLHLPTTIAPRYGDPSASGLMPHQAPEYSLTANNGFSLSVRIEGELAKADFECPSHPVAVAMLEGTREFSLSGGATLMDRDFVLLLKEPKGSTIEGLWVKDGDQFVVLAPFHPAFPDDVPASPRCVKLLVDCSGSMTGDSIAQAKVALHEILSLLKPTDFFNLITFGSSYRVYFPEPVPASEVNIKTASAFVDNIDANMGGTEIGTALEAAYHSGGIEGLPSDILLITDGNVWNHEALVDRARKSGHRVFTVGVGSAVTEAFVREIAEATSGACELVSPREDMAGRIVRHFQRIDQPMAKRVKVAWPTNPIHQTPEQIQAVYAGDTLHVFGWLNTKPEGEVKMTVTLEDGRTINQSVKFSREPASLGDASNDLAHIAAYQRLATLDADKATDLAVRYELITEYTSCILVFDREGAERSDEVPALRKVPQVLAAGWGGMGNVMYESWSIGSFDYPVESADNLDISSSFRGHHDELDPFVRALNDSYPESLSSKLEMDSIADLMALGLEPDFADELLKLAVGGVSEHEVVITFLVTLARGDRAQSLSRHVKRLIRMAEKEVSLDISLIEAVNQLVDNY